MRTDDRVQFAQLPAELDAAGRFDDDTVSSVARSRDGQSSDVIELQDRAVSMWEELGQHTDPAVLNGEITGAQALRATSR